MTFLFRFFILFFVVFSFHSECAIWRIKSNVYHGEQPTVADVFVLNKKNTDSEAEYEQLLKKPLIVDDQRTWVSANRVLQKSTGIDYGIKGKLWVDLCISFSVSVFVPKVKAAIESKFSNQNIRIKDISPSSASESICIDKSAEITLVDIHLNNRLQSNMTSTIHWSNGFKKVISWRTNFEVLSYVSLSDFYVNKKIITNEIHKEWKEINNVHFDDLYMNIDTALLSTRKIFKGNLITRRNSKVIPAIQKGDFVYVHVNKGNLKIESKARALEDGEKGDTILVLVENAEASIKTTVDDKGVVSVSL